MKKIALVFVAAMTVAMVVSACSTSQECPAYSQAESATEAVA